MGHQLKKPLLRLDVGRDLFLDESLELRQRGAGHFLFEILRELLPLLGLPVEVRFLAFGLIMVLMMRYRPAGMLPIAAVAAQMRAGRTKRRKTKPVVGIKK